MVSKFFSLKSRRGQLFMLILGAGLFACSSSKTSTNSEGTNVLRDGVVALSRPVPQSVTSDPMRPMLGFMPSSSSTASRALVIDRDSGKVSLIVSGVEVGVGNGPALRELPAGNYRVKLVQQDPVWYAPDSYFELRQVPVPEQFAAERFRRGALGSRAIFLDNDIIIHSSEAWDDTVGGLQIPDESLARFFDGLSAGQDILVK